jgi:hypothetical protein
VLQRDNVSDLMGKRILTDELLANVPALIRRGLRAAEIAASFGCTPNTLRVTCSRKGISLRRSGQRRSKKLPLETAVAISRRAMAALSARAAVKGCSEIELASDLLEIIARDDLYDAVLDGDQ